MQWQDGKVKWKGSRWLLGNRWRTNWIRVEYVPFVIADSSEKPRWFARMEHWTWEIHSPDHLMSMCNDIDWTWKGNDGNCISNSERSRNMRKDSCSDTGRFWVLETKRSGMELFLKENGTLQHFTWWNDSRYRSSSIQEYQCFEPWNPEEEN